MDVMAKVEYRPDSMYRTTKIVDNKYLDTMNYPISDTSTYTTYPLQITPKYEYRPDVMAYDLYGNAKLWWVFAMFNQDILNDPIMDFKSGVTLNVPTKFV